jgi:hypothetical protein
MQRHIFIDHSNIWGGARLASKIRNPEKNDADARLSVRNLDQILRGRARNVVTKIVSGGVPPGMETVWIEYQNAGYDTNRLFRDTNWKERGVDHSLIGHMWRLATKNRAEVTQLTLASGDGKSNEFGTSFFEILELLLTSADYEKWHVTVATFDWDFHALGTHSPTSNKVRRLVENSPRADLLNLFAYYDKVVFHKTQVS